MEHLTLLTARGDLQPGRRADVLIHLVSIQDKVVEAVGGRALFDGRHVEQSVL